MADSSSSGDADVDAVFGGAPSTSAPAAPVSTGDPDVDAAIKGLHGGSNAAPVTTTPTQDVQDLVARNVTRGGASIWGGVREIGELATGSSLAEADTDYKRYVAEHTYQPRGASGKQLADVNDASQKWNPLNMPSQAINDVGDVLGRDLFGSREAGAWIGGAGQAAAGLYGLRSIAHEGSAVPKTMEDLRGAVGPDVTSSNPVEHGDTLVDAYQAKDAVAKADISAKYKELTDRNGGQLPVDAVQLDDNVNKALHDNYVYEHAIKSSGTSAELKQLSDASASGSMSLEQYEAMRTNLAAIMRSSNNPLEVKAAGIIRDKMEELPLTGGAAELKPIADAARAAAKARKDTIEADPAYKAAINESPNDKTRDTFVSRYVINGGRDAVSQMRANLSDDPKALQTIGVATIDKLNELRNPTNAYRNMQPKMDSLLAPEHQEALDSIIQKKASSPGIVRKTAAHLAPVAGATIGSMLGPFGAGVGDLAGQTVQRKILGQ